MCRAVQASAEQSQCRHHRLTLSLRAGSDLTSLRRRVFCRVSCVTCRVSVCRVLSGTAEFSCRATREAFVQLATTHLRGLNRKAPFISRASEIFVKALNNEVGPYSSSKGQKERYKQDDLVKAEYSQLCGSSAPSLCRAFVRIRVLCLCVCVCVWCGGITSVCVMC